nr:hypothetical protein [Neobacillus sp. Marseille-Q6967]
MKRMPFERPTDYYDERISYIDEQICALFKQRKEISRNNPGFPHLEDIASWAKKYGLYEDFLNSIFSTLRMEEEFKPRIEPVNFLKHIPILKSVEKDGRLYTITFIRQFENASVVQLNIDWDDTTEEPENIEAIRHHRPLHQHNFIELSIGEDYECRSNRGGGSGGHYRQNFIVSPPIPDDPSDLQFVFKEYQDFYKSKSTGLEIVFKRGLRDQFRK